MLLCKIIRYKKFVIVDILRQDIIKQGVLYSENGFELISDAEPQIFRDALYVKGTNENESMCANVFDTEEEAINWVDMAELTINKFNSLEGGNRGHLEVIETNKWEDRSGVYEF